VFTDIASADKLAADAVTLPGEATNRTLPAWLLEGFPEGRQTACTRPDLILVTPSTTCPPALDNATNPTLIPARNIDIHLVEIKYCEDTRPKGQLEHAQTQHSELIANLKAQGCCAAVHLHVILIGVAGTIYIPHTLEPLKRLGLDHQHATQLACRLNAHSCAWRLPRNSKGPNATMLLPLHSMMVEEWVAVPRPGTLRTLISLGAVGSWSVGWGSIAWEWELEWEVSGLLFCCLLLLLLNTPVGFELCACTYSASPKLDGNRRC